MRSERLRGRLVGLCLLLAGAATSWAVILGHPATAILIAIGAIILLVQFRPRVTYSDAAPSGEANVDVAPTALLRAMLDQAPSALLTLSADGRLRAANRAARALFLTDELVTTPDPTLVAQIERARPSRSETVHLAGPDRPRIFRLDVADLTIAPQPQRLVALTDIAAEVQAAEARALRELLLVLSHEIMNGITPVASLAESALDRVASDPEADAELRSMLDTLARRAGGLGAFTKAYRELAQVPAPRPRPVHLAKIVDDLSRLFEGRWRAEISFEVIWDSEEGIVHVDRDQTIQAVWALLQNAAEAALASLQSPARVRLTATWFDGGFQFLIDDSGNGVFPADVDRIFHPFVSTKMEGTGVGLSLARQIARGHGGDVALVSPGTLGGAAFRIWM